MAKRRVLNDVHPGQMWIDRDKRMSNRRVKVLTCRRDGIDRVFVTYRCVDWHGDELGSVLTSRYNRFQRAFDLVQSASGSPEDAK